MPTRMPSARAVAVAATLAVALVCTGCTGSTDDTTASPSTPVASTSTASPQATSVSVPTASPASGEEQSAVTITYTVPAAWTEEGADAIGRADAAWTVGGTGEIFVTLASEAPISDLSLEAFFQDTYGGLGEEDGVAVEHSESTTDAGDPLLLVTLRPAGGLGGSSQAVVHVFAADRTVVVALSTDSDLEDQTLDELMQLAESVEVVE